MNLSNPNVTPKVQKSTGKTPTETRDALIRQLSEAEINLVS